MAFDITALKEFSDRLGPVYGTEDWCLFLYALVKMQRPHNIVELGVGCGTTTVWLAQAVKENKMGHIWAIDDGSEWPSLISKPEFPLLDDERKETHEEYFNVILEKFNLTTFVTFSQKSIPPLPTIEGKIEILLGLS